MSLVQCAECRAQISSSANSCPQCGFERKSALRRAEEMRDKARRSSPFWLLTWILPIIVIASLSWAGFSIYKSAKDGGVKPKIVYSFSAKQFEELYEEDKVSADLNYFDKQIRLSGKIRSIETTTLFGDLSIYVRLEGGVSAVLAKSERDRAKKLSKGQHIVVQGKCKGYRLFTSLCIVDSEFIDQ